MPGKIPDRETWGFSSGRAAALESRMAGRGFYDRLLAAESAEDLIAGLTGSLLADAELGTERLADAQEDIAAFYRSIMEEIRDRSPFRGVAELLLMKRELRAFRNHVKRTSLGVDVSAPESDCDEEFLAALWRGTAPDAPCMLAHVAERVGRDFGPEEADVEAFDAAFDSALLSALRVAAVRTENTFITGYWDRFDTVQGVEFLWRAETLGLPGELADVLIGERAERDFLYSLKGMPPEEWAEPLNSKLAGLNFSPDDGEDERGGLRLRAFTDAAGRWLMNYARDARLVAFGPERVFGALLGLENEAYNMRVALVGRASGISAELLKNRLKACYV